MKPQLVLRAFDGVLFFFLLLFANEQSCATVFVMATPALGEVRNVTTPQPIDFRIQTAPGDVTNFQITNALSCVQDGIVTFPPGTGGGAGDCVVDTANPGCPTLRVSAGSGGVFRDFVCRVGYRGFPNPFTTGITYRHRATCEPGCRISGALWAGVPPPAPAISSFVISPTSGPSGTQATLSWSTSNVIQNCTLNGAAVTQANVLENGSQSVTVVGAAGAETFELTCPGVTASQTAAFQILGNRAVSLSLPSSAGAGQVMPVSWTSAGFLGATQCSASATPQLSGWSGSGLPANGSAAVTLPIPGAFTLRIECQDGVGSAFTEQSILVNGAPPQLIAAPACGSTVSLTGRAGSSAARAATLSLVGVAPTFSGMTCSLTGTDAANFSVTPANLQLVPGQSATVVARFSPPAGSSGTRNASLTCSGPTIPSTCSFTLAGQIQPASPTFDVTLSPSNANFSCNGSNGRAVVTYTISENADCQQIGAAPIATPTWPNGNFTCAAACGGRIAVVLPGIQSPGASTTVGLRCTSRRNGVSLTGQATLSVPNNICATTNNNSQLSAFGPATQVDGEYFLSGQISNQPNESLVAAVTHQPLNGFLSAEIQDQALQLRYSPNPGGSLPSEQQTARLFVLSDSSLKEFTIQFQIDDPILGSGFEAVKK